MSPVLSAYLDLVRVGAAIVVALHHVWPVLFPNNPLPFPGHHAVIVFFVLSGFVIAYATENKDRTFNAYVSNRLSRLWSVVIPALLLGAFMIPIVGKRQLIDAAPVPLDWSSAGASSALNLVFVSQFWSLNEPPPFNMPFWSLSYEAAYYAIFAAWIFAGQRWRAVLTIVCCALAGPKILLLMPCWLLGVWLYQHPNARNIRPNVAIALFAGSIFCYLVIFWIDLPIIIRAKMFSQWPWPMERVGASNNFVGDYIIALIITVNFAAVSSVPMIGDLLLKAKHSISLVASFTLSIYLYHIPLLVLLHENFGGSVLVTLGGMIVGIIILGLLTEHKRTTLRWLITSGLTMMSNPSKASVASKTERHR